MVGTYESREVRNMTVGEAFTKWLEQHPKAGGSGNRVVRLTLTSSVKSGTSAPWEGGASSIDYEVIAYDELGILVNKLGASDSEITFYPWASVHQIQ
jgi:hypothetical protein